MNLHHYGIVCSKKDFNYQVVLEELFPNGFVEVPYQLIDRGSSHCAFSEQDPNCFMFVEISNYTYIFSNSLLDQISIESSKFPSFLSQNWMYYNNLLQEFYWKRNIDSKFRYTHINGDALQVHETEGNINLAQSTKNMVKETDEEGNLFYVLTYYNIDGFIEEEMIYEQDVPSTTINEILKEFFQYQEMETSLNLKCFLAKPLNIDESYFYKYTGLTRKSDAESEIEASKSNFNFASEMYQQLVVNNNEKSFLQILKNLLQLQIVIVLIIFTALFRKNETIGLESRISTKLSYITYGITLFCLLTVINFIDFKTGFAFVKFFGMLVAGIFLANRFMKLMMLKR